MTVDRTDEADFRPERLNVQGTVDKGFTDPSGNFPKQDYFYEASTNKAARGDKRNELNIGGGIDGLSVDLSTQQHSKYPFNNVKETLSGHVVEYDDTPGGERILIKHRSGSGIELRADGSIVMKTENNMIQSVSGSSALIVEGDADMKISGNLNLTVSGDMNINVGGDMNINAGGNKKETINGSSRELVYGTKGSTVRGSRSDTTTGVVTRSSLSGLNEIVKGDQRLTVDGSAIWGVSGTLKSTSESEMIISSANINMGADNLSVFGASGTIGGAGIVHYGVTFYGTTFHGDLNGTALKSVTSDVTNSQPYPENQTGTASGWTSVNDGTSSASATSDTMDSYLNASGHGTQKISVDVDNSLFNLVDRSDANDGLSERNLTTTETRSVMRDPANQNNDKFIGNAVSSKVISNSYSRTVPSAIGRLSNSTGQIRTPAEPVSNSKLAAATRFKTNKNVASTKFIVNHAYDPNLIDEGFPITGQINLSKGVKLARFLGGSGDKVTLNHIATREDKLQLARQYMMHANAVSTIINDKGSFSNHRLVVVEGLYKPGPTETPTPDSINDRATKGEAVVYELHNAAGEIDIEKTYDLATWWKDSLNFDKLILSYDTLSPDESLVAQIILIMPEIDSEYKLVNKMYSNKLQTLYNNSVQGNELIEIQSA